MAVHSIGDFIRGVFPSCINKYSPVFSSLLANKDRDGAIEKIFENLDETRSSWTDVYNIYEAKGEMLLKIVELISVLSMLTTDTEETYVNRLKLLFARKGRRVWGTRYDVLDIFRTVFGSQVYIVNNTGEEDLISNGNFETDDTWIVNGNCNYTLEARLEGGRGASFDDNGSLSQQVSVEINKTYFLHFFLKGNIRLKITDNNGRFWNPQEGEFGSWSNTESFADFSNVEWGNQSIYFLTDETTSFVTIEFSSLDGNQGWIDYVRLNEKGLSPTFSLVLVIEGDYSWKRAHFAPGEDDNVPTSSGDRKLYGYFDVGGVEGEGNTSIYSYNNETKAFAADRDATSFSHASYFDNAFIFGIGGAQSEKIYSELLNIVKPSGVWATVELLMKNPDDKTGVLM